MLPQQQKSTESQIKGAQEHTAPVSPKDRRQQIILLTVASLFLLVLGVWLKSLKQTVGVSLLPPVSNSQSEGRQTQIFNQQSSGANSRQQDTDGDGLTDWEELNVYNTSPYLVDSDSDGVSDAEEINKGENPNCAAGQNCVDNLKELAMPNVPPSVVSLNAETFLSNPSNKQIIEDVLAGKGDAQALRQALLEAGMDKELLDQISDDDLLASYRELIEASRSLQDSSKNSEQNIK